MAYHVLQGKRFFEIAQELELDRKAVEHLIHRAKARSTSQQIDDLMRAVEVLPKSGRKKRVEPGSSLSLTIREGVQTYDTQPMQQAANYQVRQRQALSELDPNIRPIRDPQVYNILQDPQHCEKDPQEHRPITRKRQMNRNEQSEEHVNKRLCYLGDLQQLDDEEALIICTDEKAYHFGGTPNQRTS